MAKNPSQSNKKQKTNNKKSNGKSTIIYLFTYNFFQVIGWSYIFYLLVTYYLKMDENKTLYETVKWPLIIFQNLAILEVFNSLFKLVSSNTIITLAQVYSRVIVVVGVLIATPDAKQSIGLPICIFAWSIAEIIRYLFYALNLITKVPSIIQWFRYSAFYILYPIGISGELLCFYAAQNYAANIDSWKIEINNFQITYRQFLITSMLVYVPIFPKLFGHMMNQRKKVLKQYSGKVKTN